MPDAVAENLFAVAVVLAAAAVGLAVWALASGRGKFLGAALACGVLAAGVFGADRLIVTEAEVVEARVEDLAAAVVAGEVEAVLAFFSPTAAGDRAAVRTGMGLATIDPDLRLTDWDTTVTAGGTAATCHFRANGTIRGKFFGGGNAFRQPTRWLLSWRKEGDPAAWKVVEVRRLDVMTGEPVDLLGRR